MKKGGWSMDGQRFDALTRALATRTNRRRVVSSALGIGAGFIAAAGAGVMDSVTAAPSSGTCVLLDGACAAPGADCTSNNKRKMGICANVAGPKKTLNCVCTSKKV
jgi:hypothetical protein